MALLRRIARDTETESANAPKSELNWVVNDPQSSAARRLAWELGSEVEANFVACFQISLFECLCAFPDPRCFVHEQDSAAEGLGALHVAVVVFYKRKPLGEVEFVAVDGGDAGGEVAELIADVADAGELASGILEEMKPVALAEREGFELQVFAGVFESRLVE